jgi:hypothetical protein
LLGDQAELPDEVLSVIFLCNRNNSGTVVGDHHGYDWPRSFDILFVSQVVEDV